MDVGLVEVFFAETTYLPLSGKYTKNYGHRRLVPSFMRTISIASVVAGFTSAFICLTKLIFSTKSKYYGPVSTL